MTPEKVKKVEREKPIPEAKLNAVKELADLIKNKKTVLIASIKNLPASQYQQIVKKLRGTAIVKVPKRNLIFRGIEASGNAEIKKLEEKIHEDIAVLFSDLDCFELASELLKNKTPASAKAGQKAPEDIEIQAGPTDLVPGPAISELGAVGLQVQIKNGKIEIKESKVIVKEDEEISENAAAIMNKLDIKPFSVGLVPLVAFDTKENKLYSDIKIDSEEALANLKQAFGKALPFAVEMGYVGDDTIKFLLSKAEGQAKVLGEKFAEARTASENKGTDKEKGSESGEQQSGGEEKPASEGKKEDVKEEVKEEKAVEEKKEEKVEEEKKEEKVQEEKKSGEVKEE